MHGSGAPFLYQWLTISSLCIDAYNGFSLYKLYDGIVIISVWSFGMCDIVLNEMIKTITAKINHLAVK